MPCNTDEFEDDEDWDDSEPDEPVDEDDDDTIPCPYCGKSIHEDSERCPHCESYISREDAPPARRPLWLIIGAVAGLAVVYMWIMRN
jgi:predicted nucleic acid-binding Zn ribbon protein